MTPSAARQIPDGEGRIRDLPRTIVELSTKWTADLPHPALDQPEPFTMRMYARELGRLGGWVEGSP